AAVSSRRARITHGVRRSCAPTNVGLTPVVAAAHLRTMATAPEWIALRVDVAAAAADAVVNFLVERGAGGVLTDDVVGADGTARMQLEAHVARDDGDALAADVRTYL